ncbi:MAG: beta-ketoacyl-ACP synthase II [Anaerolineae bacterium]|jgi:3-oxoacyl-[acyl-carrier-protein] synthase II
MARRRVVVTGMGAVTPLGLTVAATWAGLVAGKSGVALITHFDASRYPVRIAGEVKGFDPTRYMGFKEARRMARCSQLAIAAAQEAVADAGLEDPVPEPERSGVVVGTASAGLDQSFIGYDMVKAKQRLSPFTLLASANNMPAHHITLAFHCVGYCTTICTACASGTQAIGEATEAIRRGAADLILAGGTEALVNEMSLAGFLSMRALATDNEHPGRACKPFDARRDGFVTSEGSAFLVLESLEHALARGARIYAEILGYGATTDGFHAIQPDPEGYGAARAIRAALTSAGVAPEEIDYVNTHGPGTPLGDAAETKAVKAAFGEHAYRVALNSTKSMVGHLYGASGAVETVAAIKQMQEGILHPTINYKVPDPECDLDYVPNQARRAQVRTLLKNSFGLGGQNACLVIRRYEP